MRSSTRQKRVEGDCGQLDKWTGSVKCSIIMVSRTWAILALHLLGLEIILLMIKPTST